jgi:hypothetical protein
VHGGVPKLLKQIAPSVMRVGLRIHDLSCEFRYRLRIRCRPTMLVRQKVDIGAQDDGDMLALSGFAASGSLGGRRRLTNREARHIPRAASSPRCFRSSNFTTADLDDAVRLAPKGLIQKSPA